MIKINIPEDALLRVIMENVESVFEENWIIHPDEMSQLILKLVDDLVTNDPDVRLAVKNKIIATLEAEGKADEQNNNS